MQNNSDKTKFQQLACSNGLTSYKVSKGFGKNQKATCNLLLVINSNHGHLPLFQRYAHAQAKIAVFPNPLSFDLLVWDVHL